MRMTRLLLAIGALFAAVTAQADVATVLSATATSSAKTSTSVVCLLQAGCKGRWSPGSADSGANEGVYVQFDEPVSINAIELVMNDNTWNAPYVLSVNGAPATDPGEPIQASGHEKGVYGIHYAMPDARVKSVFFRLGVRKGGWQHFTLYEIRFFHGGSQVHLKLPRLVPATVTATSQLEPRVAYQPANLFDSRYDFAWSTDGKTTKGPGESLEISFQAPQEITGFIFWNGYQRSNEHFKANGRIAALKVTSGGESQEIRLADKLGFQSIHLAKPLNKASSVRLTIAAIYPGTKYKDVLLSELRLTDTQGIILPEVVGLRPAPSAGTEALVGRSLSSVVCSSSISSGNFQRSIRLRKDGSFVIYAKADDYESKKSDQVLEGNWSQNGNAVRIFGKRYADTVLQTEYGETKTHIPPSIFQSDLRIARFHDLSPHDKKQLVALIWSRLSSGAPADDDRELSIFGTDGQALASGKDKTSMLENLAAALDKLNPWTLQSPILADAMLPSDEVGACDSTR